MPGVEVTTATRSGPSAPLRATSGQFFVTGIAERGDTTEPILLRGYPDMERYLGSRTSYAATLWDCLDTFFNEGGSQAYVARVVGAAATVGTLTLEDKAGVPVDTLRIDAQNAGAWSANLTIAVSNGSVADTFRITVALDGVTVQDVNNLADPTEAVNAFATSPYIRIADLSSVTAAPNNNPASITATALSAGDDDRASVAAADLVTGLALFTAGYGDGCVAIPGYSTNAVWVGLEAHAADNRRVALLAGARNDSKSTLLGRVSEIDSEYAGLFAPWVRISDGGVGYVAISPEGYVAACRARAHDQVGPWRAPGGTISVARTLLQLDQEFSAADANDLDDGRVSVLRTVANTIRLYGWRSMSSSSSYAYLKDRDVLNYLVIQAEAALENYVFETIDAKGQLLSAINAALVGVVEPIRLSGGLYELYDANGALVDPGYKVETGSSVNTPATLATNVVNAVLSVRISPTGGWIKLKIAKVGLLSGM